ncbi:MAG: hypothetical protein U0V70_07350 [Terriglobia bacterium]
MYSPKESKNSLIRVSLVIMMGVAIFAGTPITVDAKDKISKQALKEMIAGAKTAADHQAIADYYITEATKALAKADEHVQMAASYEAWNRQAGEGWRKFRYPPGTVAHCEQLIKDNKAIAQELTDLADEHAAMAAKIAGVPFTPKVKEKTTEPAMKEKTSGRAIKLRTTNRAMIEMIAGAKTAKDHQAIADYYNTEAAKARAKADEHVQMAASYADWNRQAGEGWRKFRYPPGTIEHCEGLVKDYTATAEELTALAKEHEAMAAKLK